MHIWFDISNSPHINMFYDLIRELEQDGHRVTITSRVLANTVELLDQKGLTHTVIGQHYGKNFYKKLMGYPIRVFQLRKFLKKRSVDLAVSQSSFHSPLVARLLGIPSIYANDNEHALGNIVSFLCASKILIPEYLPIHKVQQQGASKKKVIQYPGVKEGIYLWRISKSVQGLRKKNNSDSTKIYVRPEPRTAQYYKGGLNFLDDALYELQDEFPVILLPRDKAQLNHFKQSKFAKITVVEKPLQLIDIARDCSLFIGAGGSMTRELAILGIPTISVYQDDLLEVDKYLIENGFMVYEPKISTEMIKAHLKKNRQPPITIDLMVKGKTAYYTFKSIILSFS